MNVQLKKLHTPKHITPFYRVIAPPYVHRQYRTRDAMRVDYRWEGDFDGPGHTLGGYCLDAVDTAPQWAYQSPWRKGDYE